MPPRPENAAGEGGQQRPPNFINQIVKMGFTYWLIRNLMGGNKQPTSGKREDQLWPAFPKGEKFDVYVYLTEYSRLEPSTLRNVDKAVWVAKGVPLAGSGVDLEHDLVYHPSSAVQHNGSLYLHTVFVAEGASPNPESPDFDYKKMLHRYHPVIAYLPEVKNQSGVNLLATVTDKERAAREAAESAAALAQEKLPRKIASYMKPNLTIAMVDYFTVHAKKQIPPQVQPHLVINHAAGTYDPIIFYNDFWLLRDNMIPMNETVTTVNLKIFLHSMVQWKWQLYNQFSQSLNMQVSMGMSKEGEADEIKRVFLEGNPFFLALTMVVSLLHSVFDMFAFKNDIGFWKNKENLTGLSVRTILINSVCQLIIFLYLLDSETSIVVLGSSFVGTLIEFWKVTKAMDVSVDWSRGFPVPVFKDKSSYVDSHTSDHDKVAIQYLSYALYPLVGAYAVYTLVYERHKSWYSWVLSTLVGAVYTFGFVLMCPQLYLNYKLKSVAHLPWRQMTYKFLNTIVDDLFAFVIKMPTLHRIACFRDDIIFCIFLYQKYIYPVDKTRPNEFGYSEAGPAGEDASAAAAALTDGAEGAAPVANGVASSSAVRSRVKDETAPAGGQAKQEVAEAVTPEAKKDR